MLVIEPPVDWQLELLLQQPQRTYWQVIAPQQPRLDEFGCHPQQLNKVLHWCEVNQVMWVLQYHQQRYWLTRWQQSPHSRASNWRGEVLQSYTMHGKQVQLHFSKHHVKQLLTMAKFRLGQRYSHSLEIDHGRYHLVLQQPREDMLFFPLQQQTMVVTISDNDERPGQR
ncbi:hypothetical protein [Pseudidiomarina sediminum]|uniref:hypothetical protein n=1 Tax=Pseudidiomarina sediminum TaxID=431675 RepID=UPI001C96C423|nr:hypothetical protein [Pseudidiomarina sediminum]MBY6065077.1 hypothetical protein [Pseudidiomarina sediminum]